MLTLPIKTISGMYISIENRKCYHSLHLLSHFVVYRRPVSPVNNVIFIQIVLLNTPLTGFEPIRIHLY